MQFYIPLFVASALCLATCVFALCQASQLSTTIESTEPAQTNPRLFTQRAIYVRLGVQLLALVIVFMPDAVSYYLSLNSISAPDSLFTTTTFIWKCGMFCVIYSALMHSPPPKL